jgi:hypothetical protein
MIQPNEILQLLALRAPFSKFKLQSFKEQTANLNFPKASYHEHLCSQLCAVLSQTEVSQSTFQFTHLLYLSLVSPYK